VRAVLDANVLVSALISRTGAPARLVELWLAGAFELVTSTKLLDEVERTLARPRVSARVHPDDAAQFVRVLREHAEHVADPADASPVHSVDPGDDYLLSLASHENVPLVSGDAHLLAPADRLPISSPRDFLDRLSGGD
jgi:putative PIN family toxin of toxin-antitoxin system